MSLRDALLAKGLVKKQDVQRVERELKQERGKAQAHRRPQAEIEAEERAKRKAEEQAELQRKAEERRQREAAKEAVELALRVRQIIRTNRLRSRGPFRYFHRTLDPKVLGRLEISERIAWKLRCGECAVAADIDPLNEKVEYVVISADAATRLSELRPAIVVHWVRDVRGIEDPSERLWKPEWEISLVPHRVRTES